MSTQKIIKLVNNYQKCVSYYLLPNILYLITIYVSLMTFNKNDS